MKKIKLKTRLRIVITSIMLLLVTMVGATAPTYCASFVYSDNQAFKTSAVIDDLNTCTIDGKSFSKEDYPINAQGTPTMLTLIEYGYNANGGMQDDYGLYVYIYNPQQLSIVTSSENNKVQLAVAFDESGNATVYDKFRLSFISKTIEDDYKNVFYKFKVVDKVSTADNQKIIERVQTSQRRYAISGFELQQQTTPNAIEYEVGYTWYFSGYAKGYGLDEQATSTLSSYSEKLITISLNVQQTSFRTGSSSAGAGHQNDISSVYFSVPNSYLNDYGKLCDITACWNEQKTSPIIVCNNETIYNSLLPYVNQTIDKTSESRPDYMLYEEVYEVSSMGVGSVKSKWGYNLFTYAPVCDVEADKISYLFYQNNENIDDCNILSETLLSYIDNHSSYSLFNDNVDAGRTKGEQTQTLSIDNPNDYINIKSYSDTHNGWQTFLDYGFFWQIPSEIKTGTYENLSPIQQVKLSDLISMSNASEELCIDSNDIALFTSYVQNAESKTQPETTFLFRFACTDYYSTPLLTNTSGMFDTADGDNAYKAEETVFLDFDIISLTFAKEGKKVVIPVVMSPIDIAGDVTAPIDSTTFDERWEEQSSKLDWIKWVLIALALILILVILSPILTPAFRLIIKGISCLFSLPSKLVKSIKQKR